MKDISREPVELIDGDLDAVAGGNPFGATAVVGATVFNTGSFAIGVVQGDASTLAALAINGQTNVFGNNAA